MKLHIYRRDTLERTLDLTGGDLRIGRSTENDLVLDDADKTVSRFHAELRQEQDEVILIDLHSENGTWIDGQRIQHATLSPGTTIAMGHFRLVLEESGTDAARASAAEHALAGMPVMVGQAHRGSSGTPASSSSSRSEAHASAHADAAMMAMAAAAGASANTGAGASGSAQRGSARGGSAARAGAGSATVASTRRAGAASIPKPILYGASLVVVVLLVGIPYVFWPHGDGAGAQGVGSGNAEAAGPAGNGQDTRGRRNGAAGARTPASGAASTRATGNDAATAARSGAGRTTPDANGSKDAAGASANQPSAMPGATGVQGSGAQMSSAAGSGAEASGSRPGMQAAGAPAGAQGARSNMGGSPLASVASGSSASSSTASRASASPSAAAAPAAPARPLTRAERAALAKREQAVANVYARGKAALAAGNYAEATAAFENVMREKPNHLDTAALLEQARTGVRNDAMKVASQAAALSAKGDFRGALREYERAGQIDPALEAAPSGIADVRMKMKAAGDDAYRRARQLEAVGRLQDATTQYTRAADLLPAEDANGKAARERLDMLTRQP